MLGAGAKTGLAVYLTEYKHQNYLLKLLDFWGW
jgi:hypothetical protein